MTATHGVGTYGNAVGTVTPLDHKMANLSHWVKTAANTIRAGVLWDGNATIVSGKANMSYDVRALTAVLSRGATAGAVELSNDAVYNAVTTAAPGSNSRYDVVYLWQREYSIDGTDSNPVIGVVQGTAAASPTVPSLAAFPGAISLAQILVPAGVTATNSGTTFTQTAPFTTVADGVFTVRNSTELTALGALYPQGQKVRNLATEIIYEYFALFDASTNPAGAKTAGWYPVPGGAQLGGKVVRGAGTLTLGTGTDTIITGTNVWSTTNAGAAKENGVAAFADPKWTVPIEGVYRVTVAFQGSTAATIPGVLYVKKNSVVAGGAGKILTALTNGSGVMAVSMSTEVELAATDFLALSIYNPSGGITAGANPEDLQFGIEFVRPIRHA